MCQPGKPISRQAGSWVHEILEIEQNLMDKQFWIVTTGEGIYWIHLTCWCIPFQTLQPKAEYTLLNLNQQLLEDLSNADATDFSPDENDVSFFPANRNFLGKSAMSHAKRVQEFMFVFALCNTVVISSHSHKNEVRKWHDPLEKLDHL